MSKEIKSAEQNQSSVSVEAFIMKAVENNLPIETMERLFALREKVKAEAAKEAYNNAMAKFQAECPVIEKNKEGGKTNSGQVAYMIAPLGDIVKETRDIIAKNGLSYSFRTETLPDKVIVTCIAKHELGHSEEYPVSMPNSTKTNVMSAPQMVAATITFAKRYSFINAFGITTGDKDLDQTNYSNKEEAQSFDFYLNGINTARNKDELVKGWAEFNKVKTKFSDEEIQKMVDAKDIAKAKIEAPAAILDKVNEETISYDNL